MLNTLRVALLKPVTIIENERGKEAYCLHIMTTQCKEVLQA